MQEVKIILLSDLPNTRQVGCYPTPGNMVVTQHQASSLLPTTMQEVKLLELSDPNDTRQEVKYH